MFAAIKNRVDLAKLLIEKKANVNAKDMVDTTALMFAAQLGHTDVAKLPIQNKNINLYIKNKQKETILDMVEKKLKYTNNKNEFEKLMK